MVSGERNSGDARIPSSWGTSLPVESVQELVRRNPMHIPERYIRNSEDEQDNVVLPSLSAQIPVVDLSLISSGHSDEIKKLDTACREWGFFQVVHHGMDTGLLLKIKDATRKFFEHPHEEKMKYSMSSDDIQGYGQAYVVSEEQKLDWADLLVLSIYPQKLRQNKFWPTTPPDFIEAIEAYSAEVNRVAKELLSGLSLLMEMEKDGLLELHKEVMQALRVNYYPMCCRPHQVVGISPHSDSSSITILLQDDDITGLQIQHAGKWVPVKPIPNALVVNIGDVIEVWSNGKYKSIEHRAMTNTARARISFASFICPNDDVKIEPLDQSVAGNQHLKMYRSIRYGDYLRYTLKRRLDGKSHIEIVKLQQEPDDKENV